MRKKLVEVMVAQKEIDSRSIRSGLQLFADGGDGTPGDDDDGGDPEEDNSEDDDDQKKGKKYTDEEVDALIERKFAEWQKKNEKRQTKKDEAERLRNMSDQERKDHEMEDLRQQVAALQKKETMSNMSATARNMLAAKGITVGDDLVAMLVSEDADATKSAVDSFINAFQDAVNRAVKDELKGETPRKGGASKLTKDQIMKVKDRAERQKLIQENMDLFK